MVILDMNNHLMKALNEIETEIQQKFPCNITMSFSELFTLKSFLNWYYKLQALGVDFNFGTIGNQYRCGEIMKRNGVIYITVPKSSEFGYYIDDDLDAVELSNTEMAYFVKKIIIKVINLFCIRFPHEYIDIGLGRFKFKSNGSKITKESYDYCINQLNFILPIIDNIADMDQDQRGLVKSFIRDIHLLREYGIQILPDNIHNILNSNFNNQVSLTLSVPQKSLFTWNGKEIADNITKDFTVSILHKYSHLKPLLNNISIVVRDEKWDKDKYNNAEKEVEKFDKIWNLIL